MPVGFQIALDLDLKGFSFLFKTWNKCASGQIATFSGCFHSKKYLIGGFSSMEIFFWFPLSIALSASLFLTLNAGGLMQVFSEIGVGSLAHFCNIKSKIFRKRLPGLNSCCRQLKVAY
ncbi:hypothetical protein DITRI_Ditri04bG0081800 [Diplodiscus trichospermus]